MGDDTTLPTKEEIERLPRWARVAFAARCARRVLPLFRGFWPAAPAEYAAAVERAVGFVEHAAAAASDNAHAAARAAAEARAAAARAAAAPATRAAPAARAA